MPRKPEYQEYLDLESGRKKDGLPKDLETVATAEQIGWRKKHQFQRAIRHARAGEATPEELIYLAKHNLFYPDTPKEYRKGKNQK